MTEFEKFAFENFLIYGKNLVCIEDVERFYNEYRTTKRALWLARAMRANDIQSADAFSYYCQEGKLIHIKTYKQWCKIWQWVERKCRAKAEEYA